MDQLISNLNHLLAQSQTESSSDVATSDCSHRDSAPMVNSSSAFLLEDQRAPVFTNPSALVVDKFVDGVVTDLSDSDDPADFPSGKDSQPKIQSSLVLCLPPPPTEAVSLLEKLHDAPAVAQEQQCLRMKTSK